MTWDFAEANLLAKSSASIEMCGGNVADCISASASHSSALCRIEQADARHMWAVDLKIFNTDPPYFSNVGYADISDYFYIWHRRSLRSIYPDLFRRLMINKDDELVAVPSRERKPINISETRWNKLSRDEKAELFFLDGMYNVFARISRLADSTYPTIVYYAFRESTNHQDGKT
jgi:putative DNA methylase